MFVNVSFYHWKARGAPPAAQSDMPSAMDLIQDIARGFFTAQLNHFLTDLKVVIQDWDFSAVENERRNDQCEPARF